MGAIIAAIGLRGFLMAGAVAAIGFLAWDYKATKTALTEVRKDLAAKESQLEQAEIARDTALEFGEEQAERSVIVKTRTVTIRKRPDGNETAADILLDTINGLQFDAGGIPPSGD